MGRLVLCADAEALESSRLDLVITKSNIIKTRLAHAPATVATESMQGEREAPRMRDRQTNKMIPSSGITSRLVELVLALLPQAQMCQAAPWAPPCDRTRRIP